uniref:SH2 domain-containing protein n=1 Tax=Terrapene triunguis TaxID=2587831 RepID=A0A674KFG6_9SAUR
MVKLWYHGSISRADAETLLTLCKEGSYLVRNSETSHHDYSLSLRAAVPAGGLAPGTHGALCWGISTPGAKGWTWVKDGGIEG